MANYRDTHLYHSRSVNDRWVSPPKWQEGRHDGFQATHDDRPNGSTDKGTPYEEVPVSEGPSSSGGSTIFSSFFLGFRGRTNTNEQAEGGYSAGGTSGAGNQRLHNYGGPKSEYSDRVFESKGVNGDYSRNLGDLPRFPVQKETSSNELKVSRQRIASLENRNKILEKDLVTEIKKFQLERMRANGLEEENRTYKGELQGLYRVKVSADALGKENR